MAIQMKEVLYATMNDEGRLVIPAVYRKQLGLNSGQKVMVKLTQDGLLITTTDRALKRFQDDVASLVGASQAGLVEELLAERRIEASKEGSG